MRRYLGATLLSLFILAGVSSGQSALLMPQVSIYAAYQGHKGFAALAKSVISWTREHPHSAKSPRLLLRLAMAAALRGSKSTQMETALDHLLINYPTSLQSREFLLSVRLGSVNKNPSKADATIIKDLLNYYCRHQDEKTASAVDRIIRFSLGHFGAGSLNEGDQELLLGYYVARRAGDKTVAAELRAATRPSAGTRTPEGIQDAEMRRIALNTALSPLTKISQILAIGMINQPVNLIRYYFYRLTPAQASSRLGKRTHIQVMVVYGRYHRAERILRQELAHRRSAYREFLQTYVTIELGDIRAAEAAASQMQRDFPRSRWLKETRLLLSLAHQQTADDSKLTTLALGLITGLQGTRRMSLSFRIGGPVSGLLVDAMIGKQQAMLQVTRGKTLLLAAHARNKNMQVFLARQHVILTFPDSVAAHLAKNYLGPAAHLKSHMSGRAAAGGISGDVTSYLANALKLYWTGMAMVHAFQRDGVFIDASHAPDGETRFNIIRFNIFHDHVKTLRLLFKGIHELTARYGTAYWIHFNDGRSGTAPIKFAVWPPSKIVIYKKDKPAALKCFGDLVDDAFRCVGEASNDISKAMSFQSRRAKKGFDVVMSRVHQSPLPPPYVGRLVWPELKGSGADLAADVQRSETSASGQSLYGDMCTNVFGDHYRRAAAAERNLILYHASGLCGRFDLKRFSKVGDFGHLLEGLLKHSPSAMSKQAAVPILRLVQFGMEKFHSSKNVVRLFGSTSYTELIMLHAMAVEYAFPKLAAKLQTIAATLVQSDKPLVRAESLLTSPKISVGRRFYDLSRIKGGGEMLPYVCVFALPEYTEPKASRRYLQAMELLFAKTHHYSRAIAYGNELRKRHWSTAYTDYVMALLELRENHGKRAHAIAIDTLREFKNTPWRHDLEVIRRASRSSHVVSADAVTAMLRLDDWLIRNKKAADIFIRWRIHRGDLLGGQVLWAHHLLQIYLTLNHHPLLADRIGRNTLELLNGSGTAFDVYKMTGIYTLTEIGIDQGVAAPSRFHVGLSLSGDSDPEAYYNSPPIADTLLKPFLHTRYGLRMTMRKLGEVVYTGPRKSDSKATSNVLIFNSLGFAPDLRKWFEVGLAASGRPLWFKSGIGVTARFNFTANASRLRIAGWPDLPNITEPHMNDMAITGKWFRGMLASIARVYMILKSANVIR